MTTMYTQPVSKEEGVVSAVPGVHDKPPTLKEVAEKNSAVLCSLDAIFPFDFFPSTVVIDLQKISIINRLFFFTKQVVSIPIKEIFVVECDTDLFFATLRIKDKRFTQEPVVVNFLRKSEAREARRVIQGLMAVYEQQLDTDGMSPEEVKKYAQQIGSTYVATL